MALCMVGVADKTSVFGTLFTLREYVQGQLRGFHVHFASEVAITDQLSLLWIIIHNVVRISFKIQC